MARSSQSAPNGGDEATARRKKTRERRAVTAAALAEVALSYLNRRDATCAGLARYLERWVATRGTPAEPAAARPLIAELVQRYRGSGLLDDTRYATNAVESWRARGRSTRAITQRLAQRGVESGVIDGVLGDERRGGDADLKAAVLLVQKRKLGALRPLEERAANRRRDLAALARAGFDFDTARRALGVAGDETDEF